MATQAGGVVRLLESVWEPLWLSCAVSLPDTAAERMRHCLPLHHPGD